MGVPIIQDVELQPGDFVDVEYEIRDTVNFLEAAAISSVKQELAKDPRFHYQGSEIQERVDLGVGFTWRYLVITVQVADPSKISPPPEGWVPMGTGERLEAGVGKVSVLIALIATALVGSTAVIYKTYTVRGIQADPNLSSEEKIALAKGLSTPIVGFGSGVAALGGSLVTVAIVLSVLWGLSLISRRQS